MNRNSLEAENRQFPRVSFIDTNWLFLLELGDLDTEKPIRLEAQNISLSGLKFNSNVKIPIFEKVAIQLVDRNGKDAPIDISGKIIRVEEVDIGLKEKTYGLVMEFDKQKEENHQRLSDKFLNLL